MDQIQFRERLCSWFQKNKRPLPWRRDKNWYRIWISEAMLQQTQVNQAIPYFNRFIARFPDVAALAAASLDEVMRLWAGLGYYARARNLHKAARIIVSEYKGKFPRDDKVVRRLPGFGPYTTHAVLSLAFNAPLSVVDGNVIRIIARLFSIDGDIRKTAIKKQIAAKADVLLDPEQSGVFNEAMMELGATVCLPRNPLCKRCPISEFCRSVRTGVTDRIPFKSPAAKKPTTQVTTYITLHEGRLLLVQRPLSGLLGGLWEFPSVLVHPGPEFSGKFPAALFFQGTFVRALQTVRHSFTHFNLLLQPVLYQFRQDDLHPEFYIDYKWLRLGEIADIPMHRSMQRILMQAAACSEIISQ